LLSNGAERVLEVDDLHVGLPGRRGTVEVVRGVSFAVHAGEALGIVGESGSGKTLTALSILRVLDPAVRILRGRVTFRGRDLTALPEREFRAVRGRHVSMVFQDPTMSLNPAFSIGRQLTDVITTHQGLGRRAAWDAAADTLALVGIPAPARRLASYPHQLSGGMRQRVLIGMAIACRPRLLIADDPTTSLDATVQSQVMTLLNRLRRELGLALLFITHNLDVAGEVCDRVMVMYAGRVVEEGPVEHLFRSPRHPYTRALMGCVPRLHDRTRALSAIPGVPPSPGTELTGCSFQPRCPDAIDRCRHDDPPDSGSVGDRVACWLVPTRS
jgi:oligopeptide/dipeptide ABC transporter ATP-binding protein